MVKYIYDNIGIIFEYNPINGTKWIEEKFEEDGYIVISNTFYFR